MTIVCKIHERGEENLVAACDEDLLGETFRDGDLKIAVEAEFYDDGEISAANLGKQLDHATIANLTGPETVRAAIDLGFVDEANVLEIDGVPHAQFVTMS